MWMMGYNNDGGEFNHLSHSFNGPKLHPLIPRPTATSTSNMNSRPCIHGTDLLALNHHLATMGDQQQNKRDEFMNSSSTQQQQQVVVSSRWNPTAEQLHTLEELYQRGTRTPSAQQIQHITAQLRRYGRIEGKNVFYWFQNHKARERQKRRRHHQSAASDQQYCHIKTIQRKESAGANRTGFEVEQTKNWALHPTNGSTFVEKTVPIQRAAVVAECRTDGWGQFEERELQQRRSLVERNGTWQMMQLSCSPPTHLINTSTVATKMHPKFIKTQDLNIFIAPYREDVNHLVSTVGGLHCHADKECYGESQILQLFP